MAKQLSAEGINAILKHRELYADVATALNIAPQTLHAMLYAKKRSRRFLQHDVINIIAQKINVPPSTLIEETATHVNVCLQ